MFYQIWNIWYDIQIRFHQRSTHFSSYHVLVWHFFPWFSPLCTQVDVNKPNFPISIRVLVQVVGSVVSERWNILIGCLDSSDGTPLSSCPSCVSWYRRERVYVRVCVDHYRYHVSASKRVWCRLTFERKPMWVIPGCVRIFLGPIRHQPPPVSLRK